jgi:hypothetical protein
MEQPPRSSSPCPKIQYPNLDPLHPHLLNPNLDPLSVRANSLFKLENRNPTRLVQKPKWTRLRGKSDNVYSGTRIFWCFRDRSNIKSVYWSTHFHFCPSISSNLASIPISSEIDFPALNKVVARTAHTLIS